MKINMKGWAALALGAVAVLAVGCAQTAPAPDKASAPDKPAASGAVSGKTGAQLWAENCMRCHNTRSPDMYSDAQWEVAMLHMRARANLTAEEHQTIVAFLKFAH